MKPCPACATALTNDAMACDQPDCEWVHVPAKEVEDWTPDPPAEDTGVLVAVLDIAKYAITEGLLGFVLVFVGASAGYYSGGGVGLAVGVVLAVALFALTLLI